MSTETNGAATPESPETAAAAEPSQVAPESGPSELERLRAELEAARDQTKRAQAELLNFQARTRKEREADRRYRNEALLRDLLPVLDNFDRALTAGTGDPKGLVEGIRLLQREALRVLDSHGVKPFDCDGQAFNPAQQEVLETVEDASRPDQQVIGTLRRGYLYHDRVLQVARVRLAVHPKPAATEPEPKAADAPAEPAPPSA